MSLPEASEYAAHVDHLFLVLVIFSLLVVLLVGMLILVFSIRYRSGSRAPRQQMPRMLSREFEIGWTAASAFLALSFFWWLSSGGVKAITVPADALEVHVEAKQWMWKTRQANGLREIDALHVPAGQPVVVYLNSQDVIHSFYVPALRLKRDVVPGRTEVLRFKADRTGSYPLLCAEYCGTDHSVMRGTVVVMRPEDYARWLDSRPQGQTLAAEGEALFVAAGCAGCHAPGSKVHAPDLHGLYGMPVPLQDGRIVTADDAYIRDSILLPRRDLAAGYAPVMPSFAGKLDDAQVTALVAYIRSLGTP
jgi:cytochrome c oxidase subunit 2